MRVGQKGARVRLSEGGKGVGARAGAWSDPNKSEAERQHQHQFALPQSVVGRREGYTEFRPGGVPSLLHSQPRPVSTREKLLPYGKGDARGSLGESQRGEARRREAAAHRHVGEKS